MHARPKCTHDPNPMRSVVVGVAFSIENFRCAATPCSIKKKGREGKWKKKRKRRRFGRGLEISRLTLSSRRNFLSVSHTSRVATTCPYLSSREGRFDHCFGWRPFRLRQAQRSLLWTTTHGRNQSTPADPALKWNGRRAQSGRHGICSSRDENTRESPER